MQGLRIVHSDLSRSLPRTQSGVEQTGLHGSPIFRQRVHGLWRLFLCVPGTGRFDGLPAQGSERLSTSVEKAMARLLIKGNVAAVKGALLSGCRAFYGYPITPASEVAEAAALYFSSCGGVFLQAESEVAAINMVYGAAATGARVMTA